MIYVWLSRTTSDNRTRHAAAAAATHKDERWRWRPPNIGGVGGPGSAPHHRGQQLAPPPSLGHRDRRHHEPSYSYPGGATSVAIATLDSCRVESVRLIKTTLREACRTLAATLEKKTRRRSSPRRTYKGVPETPRRRSWSGSGGVARAAAAERAATGRRRQSGTPPTSTDRDGSSTNHNANIANQLIRNKASAATGYFPGGISLAAASSTSKEASVNHRRRRQNMIALSRYVHPRSEDGIDHLKKVNVDYHRPAASPDRPRTLSASTSTHECSSASFGKPPADISATTSRDMYCSSNAVNSTRTDHDGRWNLNGEGRHCRTLDGVQMTSAKKQQLQQKRSKEEDKRPHTNSWNHNYSCGSYRSINASVSGSVDLPLFTIHDNNRQRRRRRRQRRRKYIYDDDDRRGGRSSKTMRGGRGIWQSYAAAIPYDSQNEGGTGSACTSTAIASAAAKYTNAQTAGGTRCPPLRILSPSTALPGGSNWLRHALLLIHTSSSHNQAALQEQHVRSLAHDHERGICRKLPIAIGSTDGAFGGGGEEEEEGRRKPQRVSNGRSRQHVIRQRGLLYVV